MTDEAPENLILETLMKMQEELADLKAGQSDIKAGLLSLCNQLYEMQGYSPEQEQEENNLQAPLSRPRDSGPLP